jgi:hypothetical protein
MCSGACNACCTENVAQLTHTLVAQLLAEHSSNFKSGIDPDYGVVSALLAAFSFRPFQISSPRYMLPCYYYAESPCLRM